MGYIGRPARSQNGGKILISTTNVSPAATVSITSGLDSTYPVYEFHFVNMHPSADSKKLRMIASDDGGSSYGIATTTAVWSAYHNEADDGTALSINTSTDSAQSTSEITIGDSTGYDNDQSCSGIMTLYDPSGTVYVKHFIANIHQSSGSNFANSTHVAGYVNTQAAINALQFSFDVGDIDAGTIYMYGVKNG